MLILFDDHPELAELYREYNSVDRGCNGLFVNSGRCWWAGEGDTDPLPERLFWSIYEEAAAEKADSGTLKKVLKFLKENYPEALI